MCLSGLVSPSSIPDYAQGNVDIEVDFRMWPQAELPSTTAPDWITAMTFSQR